MDTSEARAYLQKAERGAMLYAHVIAGVNAGLFEAIARHGESGVLPGELARELGYFEDYVRVWCETAYAWEILDHAGEGRFRLAEGFVPLLLAGRPGTLTGTLRVREIMMMERLEYPEFLRTGAVRTFLDHGEKLSRAVADSTGSYVPAIVERVHQRLPEVTARLRQGGRLLEIGCGRGRLLMALAGAFPEATFVGIDPDGDAIETARSEATASGLGDRIQLVRSGGEDLKFHEEFDLVSMYVVMHELRADIRPQAIRNVWQSLRSGGILVSADQWYPSRLEDFRKDEFYMAVMDQAAEVVWGNRHLSREQLADLFAACGFERSEFHEFQLPGQPWLRLTALAFK